MDVHRSDEMDAAAPRSRIDPEVSLAALAARTLGMARLDRSGRLLWANRAFADMCGFSDIEPLLAATADAPPFRDASTWPLILARLAEGGVVDGLEVPLATPPGHAEVVAMLHAEVAA